MKLKKIRAKLFFAFFLLTSISLLSFIGTTILFSKKTKLDATELLIENSLFLSHEKSKEINRILSYDVRDDNIFKCGDSIARKNFFMLHSKLISNLNNIKYSENYNDEFILARIHSIE